ncbi:MAG: helix-turn-helix transcriptional regulator [Oscillospiraceae bacterium]|nr:helix-turn-helix transcriptional regulator [Oscillospiraceae bacterium]
MIKIHLSRILGEKRMSQAELARQTGIRPATISEIYNKISERLNVEYLDRICEYLDCSITDLIEYIPNQQKKTGKFLIKEQHGNCKK